MKKYVLVTGGYGVRLRRNASEESRKDFYELLNDYSRGTRGKSVHKDFFLNNPDNDPDNAYIYGSENQWFSDIKDDMVTDDDYSYLAEYGKKPKAKRK